jgi:voltage-gated potassium channel
MPGSQQPQAISPRSRVGPGGKRRCEQFLYAPSTESALVGLILLSVGIVFLEVGVSPGATIYPLLGHLQGGLTVIFWLELALRFWIARSKRRYLRQYWLDILAVMPGLHSLRLLRLLRVGILVNRNLGRSPNRFVAELGAQIGLLATLGLLLLAGALGLYLIEVQQSPDPDSLEQTFWWSLFTLVAAEPIGIEDPQTLWGRLLTLMLMLGGLTLFAVMTGLVSAVMVQRLRSVMEFRTMELDELRGHIIICGWNRNGVHVIEELLLDPSLRGVPIVVVAEFLETPEKDLRFFNPSQLYFYTDDYTRLDVLETIGIAHASHAILLADTCCPRSDQDRDARTVLAALTIEKLNPAVYTCAQLLDRRNDVQLKVAGVDDVIVADEIASHLIASSIRTQGSVEVLAELLTVQMGNQIYKLPIPSNWVDLPFWQAVDRVKQTQDALVIAVEPGGSERKILVNPPAEYRLAPQDYLVVIARQSPTKIDD